MSRWTDEELRELVALWPMSTAAQIAYRLRRPRAAVCGKVQRLLREGLLEGKNAKHTDPQKHERAPDHREPKSCCRRHKLMTASRCNRVRSSNSIPPAVTGRSARSTRSQPSFAANPLTGSSLLPAPSANGALFFPLSITAAGAAPPNQSVLSSPLLPTRTIATF